MCVYIYINIYIYIFVCMCVGVLGVYVEGIFPNLSSLWIDLRCHYDVKETPKTNQPSMSCIIASPNTGIIRKG